MFIDQLPGGSVGAGCCGGLFPKVVRAVELTPNKIIKIEKNTVSPPHFVYFFTWCIFTIKS